MKLGLGPIVKSIRESRKLTLVEACKLLGMEHYQSLWRVENSLSLTPERFAEIIKIIAPEYDYKSRIIAQFEEWVDEI